MPDLPVTHQKPPLLAGFFVLWSVVGGLVMAAGINEAWVAAAPVPTWVRTAGLAILQVSDALWISLAAWLVFRHEEARIGRSNALRAFGIIAVVSGAAEWLGATTGWLFGHYDYTGQFGWRLGGVLPFTIPLAWYAVVTGACRLLDAWKPLPLAVRGVLVGGLATLTDVNLEPVAIYLRNYWQWTDGPGGTILAQPPAFNYLTWFVLSGFLSLSVPMAQKDQRGSSRVGLHPVAVLAWMNALFFLAHLGRAWRG